MARKKRTIGTIDAETDPFKYGRIPAPFSWGFFDGDNYIDFWGDDATEQLVEYLSTESDIILYAHNGGKFDFFFLLPYLDEELHIINGRIAKATMFDGAVELRDSWLILPMPLSSMAKDEIDYEKMERAYREKNKPEILRYQKSDCIHLYDWVYRFVQEFGSGLTLAGAAFKQLKKTDYEVGRTYDEYDSKFRPFYFGGRVQCFEVGSFVGDYIYIDINSSYPNAMLKKHWYGSHYVEHLRLPEKENGSWFAEITAISKGALPFRGDDDKLYFPSDNQKRKFKATGWEIQKGLETNTLDIIKCHKSYRPLFTKDFSEYVNRFFEMKAQAKKSGDKALYKFAKLMLNSCYGKFGQDGRKFEKFCITEFGDLPEQELERVKRRVWQPYSDTITGQRIYSSPDPQNSFFNVPTAGSITGFGRAHLWGSICDSERPLYCDTDSITCKKFNGEIGDKIGQWDIEARVDEVFIAQRKMYGMRVNPQSKYGPINEVKVASKGVKLSFEEIKRGVLSGKNLTQYRDAPAFSLKYGARFFSRETNFEELDKNLITNPN